jgi:hypothetical protein
VSQKQEMENIRKWLRAYIKSIPDVVEDEQGRFRKGKGKVSRVWLDVGKKRVTVKGVGYYYRSLEEVKLEEFELKGAVEDYLRSGYKPRLTYEERKEEGGNMLYCVMSGMMSGVDINVEFRPKWYEILNGTNRMVFTEYENARTREKNRMMIILKDLRKITNRAEDRCRKLGYDVQA